MKKLLMILPLALILCFMVGCQDKAAMAELEEFRAQAALEEQNLALVTRYHDAWLNGDFEAIKEILSPEYVWHSMSGDTVRLERTLKTLERQIEAFSDRTIVIEDVIEKGDRVIDRYVAKSTREGKMIEVGGIEIIRIENGKIVEIWESVDWLEYYRQLGRELNPKEGEK